MPAAPAGVPPLAALCHYHLGLSSLPRAQSVSEFSGLHWVIFLAMVALAAALLRGLWSLVYPGGGAPLVCTTCGYLGPTRRHTRGSLLIEIVLWLLFIVPGLVYSLWRLSTRRRVCAACGNDTLVPPDTPKGRQLMQQSAGH